ncbi:MAG: hypothetical protein D6826_08985 [Alphaproteobacteria bacterium]|nr:MAG: hypothetical protein D6826_08985 [Alphaproteobacteria bacterium]
MLLGVSLGVGLFSNAQAQTISGSPHDLSSARITGSPTDEVCVFCHTPHGGDNTAPAPLWNKQLPDPAGFTTYDSLNSATIDGNFLAVGSVSIACLSCHDGSQAMDMVINAPGSGGLVPGGAELSTTAIGTMPGLATNIGKDISNDHPIGIEYGGFTRGGNVIDPDFNTADLQTATIGTNTVWWLDVGSIAGRRDKNDIILYTRDNTSNGGLAAEPFVECGSCHDPHQGNGTGAESDPGGPGTAVNFMRVANTGSQLCLTCHVK